MLIDFHTHAFPEKIAQRAMANLSHAAGGLYPQTRGDLTSLRDELKKDGVDLAVVQCIATKPTQQQAVNDFAFQINQEPDFFAFGSVHPDAPDAFEELERIHAAGLKGIKLHPEYQNFYVDDERLKPLYRRISELGFITLFHAGQDFGYMPPFRATPERMRRALRWFDGPVVAAHWGGKGYGMEVLDQLCGENIYFDVAFGYSTMPRQMAQAIIDKHGPDKILFGSDLPWHRPDWEKRLLNSLDLSGEDKDKIFFRNAMKLLGLQEQEL